MGIRLDKIRLNQNSMSYPPKIINLDEAGSIYFVQHAPKTETKYTESDETVYVLGKVSHYALAVDIAGSSNEHAFVATHFDLTVVSSTNYDTSIEPLLKERTWDHYSMVKKVGKMPFHQIESFRQPWRYARELEHRLLRFVYDPLCERNDGTMWSSTLNCQTFTRSAIEYLGGEFPDNVPIISDCIPTIFNIYICTSLKTGQITEKISE